jgi:hypothetical protein
MMGLHHGSMLPQTAHLPGFCNHVTLFAASGIFCGLKSGTKPSRTADGGRSLQSRSRGRESPQNRENAAKRDSRKLVRRCLRQCRPILGQPISGWLFAKVVAVFFSF